MFSFSELQKTQQLYDKVHTNESLKQLVELCKHNKDYSCLKYVNTSQVTSMYKLFYNHYSFNEDISSWDVSKVTNMSYMFSGCHKFNSPLNNWNISKTTNSSYMFNDCKSFDQILCNWDVSNIKNKDGMFHNCKQLKESNKPLCLC